MKKNKLKLKTIIAIKFAKLVYILIKKTHLGSGATLPGYIARIFDKNILSNILNSSNIKIIVTMGTNGKTTTNNIINKIITFNGYRAIISPNGANMLNGIISAFILNINKKNKLNASYATIEVDELACESVFEYLKPYAIVITNISRDQLDRFGEIDIVISKISNAINKVQESIVILNGDDPYSVILSNNIKNKIKFYGIDKKTSDSKEYLDTIDTIFCPNCNSKLEYNYINYSSIGSYYCKKCDFKNPKFDYLISDIIIDEISTITINNEVYKYYSNMLYNAYNVISSIAVINEIGLLNDIAKKAIEEFDFRNKREELYYLNDCKIQVYLAKNPVSFKEKIKQVLKDNEKKDIIININDTFQDGQDISWLWDVDFEKLDNNKTNKIYCSGQRKYDMGLRLKYDNISCYFINNLKHAIYSISKEKTKNLHIIVNYSGLYSINNLINDLINAKKYIFKDNGIEKICYIKKDLLNISKLDYSIRIAHICPDLLNLYADRGNIKNLEMRLLFRGINCFIDYININDNFDPTKYDIIFLGGGNDKNQIIVSKYLYKYKYLIKNYIDNNKVLLAVCGGYQLLGNYYETNNTRIKGLELIDFYTKASTPRLISNIIINNESIGEIIGFENHAGRTYINNNNSFGKVIYGNGNLLKSKYEGIRYKNVFATYLHGPLLPKNPNLCDEILRIALFNKYRNNNILSDIDNTLENKARQVIIKRYTSKIYILKQKIKERI